jgi:tetratricopeptide (TPR) repeat protein
MPTSPKLASALEHYRAAAAANPKSAEAQANLGWGHYGLGQVMEALKALQTALALDPDHLEAQYGLALVYKASGSKAEAAAAFDRALALAGRLEDRVRRKMLERLIRGHVNQLNSGDWNLGQHETHA